MKKWAVLIWAEIFLGNSWTGFDRSWSTESGCFQSVQLIYFFGYSMGQDHSLVIKMMCFCQGIPLHSSPENLKLGNNMPKPLPTDANYQNSDSGRSAKVLDSRCITKNPWIYKPLISDWQICVGRPRKCVLGHIWHAILLIISVLRYKQTRAASSAHI